MVGSLSTGLLDRGEVLLRREAIRVSTFCKILSFQLVKSSLFILYLSDNLTIVSSREEMIDSLHFLRLKGLASR